ncbi:hypothetical protein C8R43DRAFT_1022736 [Mycena crocata]|nr:hypothetical protein C8R43DRAFT_1022736 [Mycena crocata]
MTVVRRPCPPLSQELWDQIVDFLRDDLRDLRSCALASRMMKSRVQHHIFQSVAFIIPPTSSPPGVTDYDSHAACRRLGATLARSPHLKSCIRRIHIPFCMDILPKVCGMGLPRLISIEFYPCGQHKPSTADIAQISLFDFARQLLELPSIRAVQFQAPQWRSYNKDVRLQAMARLFQGPISHIQNLTVWSLKEVLFVPAVDTPIHRQAPNTAQVQRARIRKLRLFFSPLMGEYLMNPACPFDLSQLSDVEIIDFAPTIGEALEAGRLSIKRLVSFVADLSSGLDLCRFPNITRLELDMKESVIQEVTLALSKIAGNNQVESVVLMISAYSVQNWIQEMNALRRLDELLSSANNMPALRKVEVNLDDPGFLRCEDDPEEHCAKEGLFRLTFPKLGARGMLEVPAGSPYERELLLQILGRGATLPADSQPGSPEWM